MTEMMLVPAHTLPHRTLIELVTLARRGGGTGRAAMLLPNVSWLVPWDDPTRASPPVDDLPARPRLRAV